MIYFVFMCLGCLFMLDKRRIVLKVSDDNTIVKRGKIGELLTIVLFSLLVAARASFIGTDTINYVYSARSILESYSSLGSIFQGYYIEPGYGVLEYLSMKWLGDVHFLFLIEAIILLVGLFSFIHNFEGKISVPLAFMVFFSFYFNTSLNISRQYIAVGVGFFAAKYLLENKTIPYFICCTIATLFHFTGILLFFSYFVWRFLLFDKGEKNYQKRLMILILGVIAACVLIRPITIVLANIGLIPEKYVDFLHSSDSASSALMTIIANSPLLILIFVLKNELIEYDERNKLVISLYLLSFIVSMLNSVFGNVGRLAVFWSSWEIILYPECCELLLSKQKNKMGRFITKSLFVVFFISFWFYCVIYRNFGDTAPYSSDLFEWLNWSL